MGIAHPRCCRKSIYANVQPFVPCFVVKSIAASSVLHLKLPALETSYVPKGDVFPGWVLSPGIMQIDKFLTLLLYVDDNSLYF